MNLAGVERVLELEAAARADAPPSIEAACASDARSEMQRRDARARSTAVQRAYRASSCRYGAARATSASKPRRRPMRSGRRGRKTIGSTCRPDRFTIKSQEAIAAAQRWPTPPQPAGHARAPARRAARAGGRHRRAGARASSAPTSPPSAPRLNAALDKPADVTAGGEAAGPLGELVARAARGRGGDARPQATSTSRPSTCCSRSPRIRRAPATRCAPPARTRRRCSKAIDEVRGPHRVTDQSPEDKYQALEKFGRDLTEAAEHGQARPGDRPRRRDPARDPGPLPPHQEQPGADRRARRRQDGDRRGPRPADRRRATSPSRCATAA